MFSTIYKFSNFIYLSILSHLILRVCNVQLKIRGFRLVTNLNSAKQYNEALLVRTVIVLRQVVKLCPTFEEEGVYCFANVGWSVGPSVDKPCPICRSKVKVTVTFKLRGHTCFTNISSVVFKCGNLLSIKDRIYTHAILYSWLAFVFH